MAASSDNPNQQQQQQGEEEVRIAGYRQPPPCDTAGAVPEPPPGGGQVWRGERSRSAAALSLRSLRLCRRLLSRLLQWFAARPLGQRALQGAAHTLAAAERAVAWAGGATARCPVPFAWFLIMPIVMALMVVRGGADLVERYLNIELLDNRDLVRWLERQRVELEGFQAVAAQNIRTQTVDQQQPSNTDSATVPVQERATPPSSSGSSTLSADEDQAAPNCEELLPPPESAGDKSIYFSLEADKTAKEQEESEAQQDNTQEETEGEKTVDEQLTPPPESAGDKSLYFSPEAHKTAKEQAESEAQRENTQEEAEGEKAQEGKLTPPPGSAGGKSLYFSPESHKTGKEQTESEAQQDNTQEEAEGEKAQEEKIKEEKSVEVATAAEEAGAMAAQRDQPRDRVPTREKSENIVWAERSVHVFQRFKYRLDCLQDDGNWSMSFSEWLQQWREEEARRPRDMPHPRGSVEETLANVEKRSREIIEREQRPPSPKKSFWNKIFR